MTVRRIVLVLALVLLPGLTSMPGVVQHADHPVTAQDVTDRHNLQEFVQEAKKEVEEHVSAATGVYDYADTTFRPMGDWRHGAVYIFIVRTDGEVVFHGANMSLEGQNLWDNEDSNGVKYAQELIRAAEMGGGFVEYLFDNPDVTGDEDDGSPKVGYAERLSYTGDQLVIGSGFYPVTNTPVAPPLAWFILTALLAGAGFLRRRQA